QKPRQYQLIWLAPPSPAATSRSPHAEAECAAGCSPTRTRANASLPPSFSPTAPSRREAIPATPASPHATLTCPILARIRKRCIPYLSAYGPTAWAVVGRPFGALRVAHTSPFMYAPHQHGQHLCHRVLTVAGSRFLTLTQALLAVRYA